MVTDGSSFWAGEYGKFEEGQEVPPSRSLVVTEVPEYSFGEEELAAKLEREMEVGDLEHEDTLAEEEAKREWERKSTPKKSWLETLKLLRERRAYERAKREESKEAKEVREYESKAGKLERKISIAKGEEKLRKHGGSSSSKFTRKVSDVKSIINSLNVSGTGGQGMREGFKKMVPRAQMGQQIYNTGASALREASTPRPDRKLYLMDTERIKMQSSLGKSTRLGLASVQTPKLGSNKAPSIDKSLVLPNLGLLKRQQVPKPSTSVPKIKSPPQYYKKQVRSIKKDIGR